MEKIKKILPSSIEIAGQRIGVQIVPELDGFGHLGSCSCSEGVIKIACNIDDEGERKQSVDSMRNTYWHEVIHLILDNMGEEKLCANEKFVSCFAGFLTEATKKVVFLEKNKVGGLNNVEEFFEED